MTVNSKMTVICYYALSGASIPSVQGKWGKIFGVEVEEKEKKPVQKKKTTIKKFWGEKNKPEIDGEKEGLVKARSRPYPYASIWIRFYSS